MGYLLIKKNDLKTFRSFLNGKEIEVGVRIGANANIFHTDDEIDVFYDGDDSDTYKARVTKQRRSTEIPGGHSLVTLGIVRQ
jgi:hypothetical protein